MSKAILISIKPQFVAEILNHRKTIEVRKTAPKCDLPIDVYIYCTKSKYSELRKSVLDGWYINSPLDHPFNGKVVAKFRMKNCIKLHHDLSVYDRGTQEVITKASCLTNEEIENYANGKDFYAWEISDLKIFDNPIPLAALGAESAPQSWAYIESDREPIYARDGRCEAYCDGKLIGGNYFLHITMNGSEIMHQKWAVMPTKAQADEILAALNPEGI